MAPGFAQWEAMMRSLFSTTTSEVGMEADASLQLPHYALPVSNSSQRILSWQCLSGWKLAVFFTGFWALPKPLSRLNGCYLQAIGDHGLACKGNTLNMVLAAGLPPPKAVFSEPTLVTASIWLQKQLAFNSSDLQISRLSVNLDRRQQLGVPLSRTAFPSFSVFTQARSNLGSLL